VFGFFAASERELNFIEKQYRRNGFDDVKVVPSSVRRLARPSGWYRVFRENAALGSDHELGRHYDVIHCMSGGFLHLYLTRGAGVPLTCDTLLLDSTPILPTPRAFTQFSRQFARDLAPKFSRVVDAVPWHAHLGFTHFRWAFAALRLRMKHVSKLVLGLHAPAERPRRDLTTAWLKMSAGAAMAAILPFKSYDAITNHAAHAVFARAPKGQRPKRAVFLHNPADPYLADADVVEIIDGARRSGLRVDVQEVSHGHVRTIFKDPKAIFDRALAPA